MFTPGIYAPILSTIYARFFLQIYSHISFAPILSRYFYSWLVSKTSICNDLNALKVTVESMYKVPCLNCNTFYHCWSVNRCSVREVRIVSCWDHQQLDLAFATCLFYLCVLSWLTHSVTAATPLGVEGDETKYAVSDLHTHTRLLLPPSHTRAKPNLFWYFS